MSVAQVIKDTSLSSQPPTMT